MPLIVINKKSKNKGPEKFFKIYLKRLESTENQQKYNLYVS